MAIGRTVASRGDVYLVRLDPTQGSEIHNTRPCLVVSPDELNDHLRTVIVTPMTTGGHAYPWRVQCRFQGRTGFVAYALLVKIASRCFSASAFTLRLTFSLLETNRPI